KMVRFEQAQTPVRFRVASIGSFYFCKIIMNLVHLAVQTISGIDCPPVTRIPTNRQPWFERAFLIVKHIHIVESRYDGYCVSDPVFPAYKVAKRSNSLIEV